VFKTPSKYGILGRNQCLFTNGCKKIEKYVQTVIQNILKKTVYLMVFKDINVMIVRKGFVLKEDL